MGDGGQTETPTLTIAKDLPSVFEKVIFAPPEKPDFSNTRVLVYEDPDNPVMSSWLREEGYPLGSEGKGFQVKALPRVSASQIRAAIRNNDNKSNQILGVMEEIPDILIIPIPTQDSFTKNHYLYQQFFVDYWANIPPEERPVIIMYTMGFEPQLYRKHDYEGFVWAANRDELNNTLVQAQNLVLLKNKKEIFTPDSLSPLQQEQYDQSLDLIEWEHKTADTYQSLKNILARIIYRDGLVKGFSAGGIKGEQRNVHLAPQRKTRTILDCGTGDGRIAGMLARLNFNVLGIDISPEQLVRGKERLKEEGQGLRGEKENPSLSYIALKRLQDEKELDLSVIYDDEETRKNYVTVHGNFFELHRRLNEELIHWEERHPEIDLYEFFYKSGFDEYAFSDPRNMFADVGFDYALFSWHTLCEVGDPENQKDIFRQLLNVLNPGGEVIIEIPDRTREPYASLLRKYHEEHPDEPFGVLRDEYQGKEFSPRYFPGREELIILLKAVGFEINPDDDIQSYFITSKDPDTGKERTELKELFITARKSKA